MRKLLLLLATVSLATFALARPADSDKLSQQSADQDWYNQTIAAQTSQYQSVMAAVSPSQEASFNSESQPQSMAAPNSESAGIDTFNQGVNLQFQKNRLVEALNRM